MSMVAPGLSKHTFRDTMRQLWSIFVQASPVELTLSQQQHCKLRKAMSNISAST
jgi:hypothetical protein